MPKRKTAVALTRADIEHLLHAMNVLGVTRSRRGRYGADEDEFWKRHRRIEKALMYAEKEIGHA